MLEGVLRDVSPRLPHLDLLVRQTADPATLDEAAKLGYAKALISCTQDHSPQRKKCCGLALKFVLKYLFVAFVFTGSGATQSDEPDEFQ